MGGANHCYKYVTRSGSLIDFSGVPMTKTGKKVHLLPYHDIARNKHEKLGTRYNPEDIPMATPAEETIEHCRFIFQTHEIEVIVGG
ncbi:hypothetical protein FACS189416_4320 [Bacteroidia bacterium]|nr:hypothetical protein FACS189416_4320 [Bacteroidia bacterium]